MKAHVLLATVALLATGHALAQSASSSGSYDWGQSQVQKSYQSPYARSSDALAATAERKRLTESRSDREDKDTTTASAAAARKPSGGKLACLGMGSTLNGSSCRGGGEQLGFAPTPYQQYQQQQQQQKHPLQH